MRYRILGGVAAAALGLAAVGAWALPASAQVTRFQPALANGADAGELLTLVRERVGGGGGSGGGGGGRADRGGGGGDRVLRMDRSGGGERFVNRDRDRREFGSRSDSRSDASRITRVVRDRDGKRRRVVVHRFYNYPHWGWGAGFGLGYGVASYAGYCMSQFQAYDPVSGLYLGYDGLWYSCP
jgi:BA14K-like protein